MPTDALAIGKGVPRRDTGRAAPGTSGRNARGGHDEIDRKTGLAIFAGVLSVSIFGMAACAYFESSATPVPAAEAISAPVVTPDASVAPAPVPEQTAPNALKEALKGLTVTAAQYLGVQPMDLATQLKAGTSLAAIASATPGRSRDGLVAALTARSRSFETDNPRNPEILSRTPTGDGPLTAAAKTRGRSGARAFGRGHVAEIGATTGHHRN